MGGLRGAMGRVAKLEGRNAIRTSMYDLYLVWGFSTQCILRQGGDKEDDRLCGASSLYSVALMR